MSAPKNQTLAMLDTKELFVGKQIAHVPPHVQKQCKDNLLRMLVHPETEYGFISSWHNGRVFCRYWSRQSSDELRTMSTSEGGSPENLIVYESHPRSTVEYMLRYLRSYPEAYGWVEQEENK